MKQIGKRRNIDYFNHKYWKMKNIIEIRNIIGATLVTIILTWALWSNNLLGKIIIVPFLVCALAFLDENIALLLNKEKMSQIFSTIFRVSFFIYFLGILTYTIYYAFRYKSYSLLIIVALFGIFGFRFFQKKV